MGDMKKCRICKEIKEFSDFHKLTKAVDGHQPKSKACSDRLRAASGTGKLNRVLEDLEGEMWDPIQ